MVEADETSTVYGIVFDRASRAGWPDEFGGRALRNPFFDRWLGREDELTASDEAHEEFQAGTRNADPDVVSVYAGQGVGALRTEQPAAGVIAPSPKRSNSRRNGVGLGPPEQAAQRPRTARLRSITSSMSAKRHR